MDWTGTSCALASSLLSLYISWPLSMEAMWKTNISTFGALVWHVKASSSMNKSEYTHIYDSKCIAKHTKEVLSTVIREWSTPKCFRKSMRTSKMRKADERVQSYPITRQDTELASASWTMTCNFNKNVVFQECFAWRWNVEADWISGIPSFFAKTSFGRCTTLI